MVAIKDVRTSNATFKATKDRSLTAVFVGATSGIGMGTLKQFAKRAFAPKIYVVGRSKSAASALLEELQGSNPEATINFLETEISLIKVSLSHRSEGNVLIELLMTFGQNVDIVCEEIKSREKKLDLLFMSPGYLSFGDRNGKLSSISSKSSDSDAQLESTEGIDIPHALRYYSRLRFAYNLLPLLNASSSGRIVSILAGGKEVAVNFDDLEYRNNFNGFKAASNGATQTSLAFEELAKTNTNVTFIHKFPGRYYN
jgi:NAD(P)-dependent dehydrogenase (short-subunit alcohol dehydrogenase family)